jgi:xylulokinase
VNQEVKDVRPGCGGLVFLPYMAGERTPIWDPEAKGVLFGLSYQTTKSDIARAIMEGVSLT